MFEIGDLVMYGSEGACRVEDIKPLEMSGVADGQLYYTLQPLMRDGTIYTPVAGKVFMRPVISREQALQLIDSIPDIKAQAFISSSMRELNEYYQSAFSSHDCADLIELIMNVYVKRQTLGQGKKLGQTDEKYMKRAEELLYGEFSIALDIPRDDVQHYIYNRVQQLKQQREGTAAGSPCSSEIPAPDHNISMN